MIDFAYENRTTSYFRDYAIKEIRIAYRIMEYLDPDTVYPAKDLDDTTLLLLKNKKFGEAVERIIEDELSIDCGCSSGMEALYGNACELCKYLLPKYLENKRRLREEKKRELLKQLEELEELEEEDGDLV